MLFQNKVTTPQKKDNAISSKQALQPPTSNYKAIIQRIKMNPRSLTPADSMVLQKTIGNQAVGRLMREIGLKNSNPIQQDAIPDGEEVLQGKFENSQCNAEKIEGEKPPHQMKIENKTGLPDNLKAGVENLSGLSMDDVRVHYHSDKPAQIGALAYAQGTEIHLASGQEKHLPHEAWHIIQQAQGRVKPTRQLITGLVNDDDRLETEATAMGKQAESLQISENILKKAINTQQLKMYTGSIQCFYAPQDVLPNRLEEVQGYLNAKFLAIVKKYMKIFKESHEKLNSVKIQKLWLLNPKIQAFMTTGLLGELTMDEVMDVIVILNIMEQDCSDYKFVNMQVQDIKFGTEFTFTRDDLKALKLEGEGHTSHDPIVASIIQEWESKVKAKDLKKQMPLVSVVVTKGKTPHARTFQYLELKTQFAWNWTLDVDEGCIETQTAPISLSGLQDHPLVGQIMQTHIFDIAHDHGFKADKSDSGGDGHISLDGADTFKNSASALISVYNTIQTQCQKWDAQFKTSKTVSNSLNAPWLAEMDCKTRNGQTYMEKILMDIQNLVRNGQIGWEGVVNRLDVLREEYVSPLVEEMFKNRQDKEAKNIGLHIKTYPRKYTAIMTTQLADNIPARRRIEFRRIPAQGSVGELVENLRLVFDYICEIQDKMRGQINEERKE